MHSIDSNSTMHSIDNSYTGDEIISNFHEISGKDWDRSPNTFIDKVIHELEEILRNRSPSNEDGQNEQNNGASKGKNEAIEKRDKKKKFLGLSVDKNVFDIKKKINNAL